MRISIFGLGYVGAVSGACLAELGHDVIGVDLNPAKVDMVNSGAAPIVEELIAEITEAVVKFGKFRGSLDLEAAVKETDVSLISVGTPTGADGAPNMAAVAAVTRDIGRVLKTLDKSHTIVVRSTVTPGYCEGELAGVLEDAAGRKIGDRLNLVFNPEFLREGRSVKDFREPPFTIIGSMTEEGADDVAAIYETLDAPVIRTEPGVAESIKILSNAYHALKISFANEAGRLLKSAGVDARAAMDVFCQDTVLNVSRAYLRPGYAFGGSCLPKDIRAILSVATKNNIALPVLDAVMQSNAVHVETALKLVTARPSRKVALFGLAFKPGTDDLRESPLVALAERLIGKGYELVIHDPFVETSRLLGKNKDFIEREIPHFEKLMAKSAAEALAHGGTLIIGHASKDDLGEIAAGANGKAIIDLAGVPALEALEGVDYEGICW